MNHLCKTCGGPLRHSADENSSIGFITNWRAYYHEARDEITKLHKIIDSLKEEISALKAQRREDDNRYLGSE